MPIDVVASAFGFRYMVSAMMRLVAVACSIYFVREWLSLCGGSLLLEAWKFFVVFCRVWMHGLSPNVASPKCRVVLSFPGMMITYRLIERLEQLAEHSDAVRIVNKCKANRLLTGADGSVIGVEYEKDGALHVAHGPVDMCNHLLNICLGANSIFPSYPSRGRPA